PRLPALGWRILSEEVPACTGMTQGDYVLHRLSLGVPEGAVDLVPDRSLPLEYGYDELNAVDFDKGCYVGQEVTARTKHRATLRKFIHKVQAERPLPAPGTTVMAGEREAGTLLSVAGKQGLAHLRVEEVERGARGEALLMAGGVALAAQLP